MHARKMSPYCVGTAGIQRGGSPFGHCLFLRSSLRVSRGFENVGQIRGCIFVLVHLLLNEGVGRVHNIMQIGLPFLHCLFEASARKPVRKVFYCFMSYPTSS